MEFVKINDYPNYSINILGEVRNDITGKIKKNQKDSKGYYQIGLSKNNIRILFFIHRLIAIHFIPNPDNKPFIDHIDNNRLNNSIENLRWVSVQENSQNRKKNIKGTSIYKGVCFSKNKWISQIQINKKHIHLGYFTDEKDAGYAYNNYIIEKNLTEFFKLNILD